MHPMSHSFPTSSLTEGEALGCEGILGLWDRVSWTQELSSLRGLWEPLQKVHGEADLPNQAWLLASLLTVLSRGPSW